MPGPEMCANYKTLSTGLSSWPTMTPLTHLISPRHFDLPPVQARTSIANLRMWNASTSWMYLLPTRTIFPAPPRYLASTGKHCARRSKSSVGADEEFLPSEHFLSGLSIRKAAFPSKKAQKTLVRILERRQTWVIQCLLQLSLKRC